MLDKRQQKKDFYITKASHVFCMYYRKKRKSHVIARPTKRIEGFIKHELAISSKNIPKFEEIEIKKNKTILYDMQHLRNGRA